MVTRYVVIVFFIIGAMPVRAVDSSVSTTSTSCWGVRSTDVTLNNGQEMGYVTFLKIPFVSCGVLHSLYIHKEFRNQGYARFLLQQAIAQAAVKKIFIQPGPYDFVNGVFMQPQGPERARLMAALIRLYNSAGFSLCVRNVWALSTLKGLYYLLGIHEDPLFLMILTQ